MKFSLQNVGFITINLGGQPGYSPVAASQAPRAAGFYPCPVVEAKIIIARTCQIDACGWHDKQAKVLIAKHQGEDIPKFWIGYFDINPMSAILNNLSFCAAFGQIVRFVSLIVNCANLHEWPTS